MKVCFIGSHSVWYIFYIYTHTHTQMDTAHCFALLLCMLYECWMLTEGMEGIVRSVKVE